MKQQDQYQKAMEQPKWVGWVGTKAKRAYLDEIGVNWELEILGHGRSAQFITMVKTSDLPKIGNDSHFGG